MPEPRAPHTVGGVKNSPRFFPGLWPQLLLALLVLAPAVAKDKASAKKGWCGGAEAAAELKANWYYNWGPDGRSSAGLEFVPMVKGRQHVNPDTLGKIKASGAKVMLGFNEPERADQGNLSVADALALWPQLEATGLRLGSPAPSSDTKGIAWLDQFMEGVKKNKLRVDFIAIHWYRSANAAEFGQWLDALAKKWRRPIWVTEFNAFYAGGDKDKFAEQAFKILEHHSKVERYAYFTCPDGQPGGLWKPSAAGKKLTDLGQAYQQK